ncbi:hypothetical protein [Arthrobacter bambusae]|nr:hypothetical protein [Arthrobacter bambusae]MDQ0030895.1 hypothetical protein [Arthrobacter bambusae]MDQ0099260.1 hypothetical protein [Arthrobacter bambusae]
MKWSGGLVHDQPQAFLEGYTEHECLVLSLETLQHRAAHLSLTDGPQ